MDKKKLIPYGISDFVAVNNGRHYYVDKTMYIPMIEELRYIFLIRPRRFGKSLFVTMLQSYYDIKYKDRFESIFQDTWILKNPTADRGKYLILSFNFSSVSKDKDKVEDDFDSYCKKEIGDFLSYYKEFLPKEVIEEVSQAKSSHEQLNILSIRLRKTGIKIYVIIDEYDNFANALLSNYGPEVYKKLTKEASYFKQFFTNLKFASTASESCLERIFITGVSPVTMDDVTSGFNIGFNVSLKKSFNNILGFSEPDVIAMLDYYIPKNSGTLNKQEALEVMRKWYNNYIFSSETDQAVYNTDAVLFFLTSALEAEKIPKVLVDDNLRVDYTRLQYLILESKKLNGNFDRLSEIINTGGTYSEIKTSFPFDMITDEENFVSLLYYFGLLTFAGKRDGTKPYLRIPNETTKTMVFGYITSALREIYDFSILSRELEQHLEDLALRGKYKPAFTFIAKKLKELTSIEDTQGREIVPKVFYLIYFSQRSYFIINTEQEMNKGKADMVMIPNYHQMKSLKYAYLVEFKYIKKSVPKKNIQPHIEKHIAKAQTQIAKYSNDDKFKKMHGIEPHGKIKLKKLIVVFYGWELVHISEEISNK
jgi:hypothetical protein